MGPEDGRAKNPYDEKRAESAIRELLIALGEDPDREGLKDTPARVARAYAENMAGLYQSPRDVLTTDRKSTRLNSSHSQQSRMPSSA